MTPDYLRLEDLRTYAAPKIPTTIFPGIRYLFL